MPPFAARPAASPLRHAAPFALTLALAACAQQGAQSPQTSAPTGAVGPSTLNVADAAIAGGDPNMALSISQSILKTDPDNVDALVHEGDAYYALDRCIPAQAAYQVALQYDAKSSPAANGLGRCLLKTDPAAAAQAFETAVAADPGNAAAWSNLGVARDLQGNFAGAVEPYQKALLADPSSTATEVNLGLSLALSGHGPEALQYLGPLATGQGATPKIREDYAAALIAAGRDDEARQVLAIDLPPDDVNKAMEGYATIIASSIQNPPPPPPPAPTVTQVTTTNVTATGLPGAPVPLAPPAPAPMPAAPVAPAAPAAVPVAPAPGGDPDAAYTGPSPIAGAVSSSTPGPVAMPPAVAPQAAPVTGQRAASGPASAFPPVPAPGGPAAVQLAALNSADAAQHQWDKDSAAAPSLFKDKTPEISPVTVNGHAYYRLRVLGFPSRLEAARFCGEAAAAGVTCTLANF